MTMISTRDQRPRLAGTIQRPRRPAAGGGSAITARDMLRIIRKRLLLIIFCLVITVLVAVVGTALWLRYAPFYTAQAYVAVAPPSTSYFAGTTPLYGKEVIERYKRTWAAMVKQELVLQAAIKDTRIKTQRWWWGRYRNDAIEKLDEQLNVVNMPETNLLALSMTGTNKNELADIVNAVADAFVANAGKRTRDEQTDRINSLEAANKALRQKIKQSRTEMAGILAGSALVAMHERRNEVTIKQELLLRNLDEAMKERDEARSMYDTWQALELAGQFASDPQIIMARDLDGMLRGLKAQLAGYSTQLENAVRKFGPEHRTVKDLETVIASMERQVVDRDKEVVLSQASVLGQMRKGAWEMTTARVVALEEQSAELKKAANDVERKLGLVEALRKEIEEADESIRMINRKLLEERMLQADSRDKARMPGPVSIRSYAESPRRPSFPRWWVMIPLGVVLGLVLGFGLAFLLELSDTSIKTPTDITRRIDVPLLGMVPHGDDLDEEVADFRMAALGAPHSLAAEAFRQIRTNLLFSGPAGQRRSILVTSPAPEDGRTTVVMNLAASMAQAGRRVLVVDANFRQPAIGSLFPDVPKAGLSSALVGQANWKDVVAPTGVANCDVIAAGPLPPNPAELLGSDAMRQLVSEMGAEYDQVLFDGSPAMVVADACVLSTQVDGVILVIRAGENSSGIVMKSVDQLNRIGAHIIGAVLQGVRTTAGGYLRKNYETFYEYHQKALP